MSESVREAAGKFSMWCEHNLTTQQWVNLCKTGYVAALRAALADKQEEPVAHVLSVKPLGHHAYSYECVSTKKIAVDSPLYTSPPTRKLTDDEITKLFMEYCDTERDNYNYLQGYGVMKFARAIEERILK